MMMIGNLLAVVALYPIQFQGVRVVETSPFNDSDPLKP